MQSIRALEPRITDIVAKMLDRLHAAHESGSVINLYHLFAAFAVDIVSEYALGKELSMNFMSNPDFGLAWANIISNAVQMNNFGRHFKGLMALMMSMPESVMKRMNPAVGQYIDWNNMIMARVQQVRDEPDSEKSREEPTTVIRELFSSDLPDEDKTLQRLSDEASMVLGAGGETTAQSLVRLFYHLLGSPDVVKRLRDELLTAMPKPGEMPSLATLQNLPYLNAVVDEGVRIAFPVAARSPRIFRDHTLQYEQWAIQPGVSTGPSVF
jgi:cytochrome P450